MDILEEGDARSVAPRGREAQLLTYRNLQWMVLVQEKLDVTAGRTARRPYSIHDHFENSAFVEEEVTLICAKWMAMDEPNITSLHPFTLPHIQNY